MFTDRTDAGKQLAERLRHLRGEDVVVLGLPRGGIPVAHEVARALDAPLDVVVVRKLGVPFRPELGMGAIGEGGARVINEEVVRSTRVTEDELAGIEEWEHVELERRAKRYRGDRPRIQLRGRTAVIVDDGIATGSTARAACEVARAMGAARVVLAVPIAPSGWRSSLRGVADELICVDSAFPFFAIGQFYDDFSQTTDDEVTACLHRNQAQARRSTASVDEPAFFETDEVPFEGAAELVEREEAQGVEVFAMPEAVIPATAMREGSPGEATYAAQRVGLGRDDDEERREPAEDRY